MRIKTKNNHRQGRKDRQLITRSIRPLLVFSIASSTTHKFFVVGENTNDGCGKFNTMHKYVNTVWDTNLNRHVPISFMGDSLMSDVPASSIQSILSDMYTNHNGTRFIWQRPKIEWLCFGQSSACQLLIAEKYIIL